MASTVTDGCDTIDTWDPATSVIVDHAAVSVGEMLALNEIGRWLATISQRSASGRSGTRSRPRRG